MSELVIKTHGFEKSKNQLKVFSEQTPKNLELDKVDTKGGLFGFFDHTVTGYELNNLTSQIQACLIDFNSLNTKFIKEFGQVYNALEALDKDYIQAILIAIKAAEKANNEVKVAQGDITKTIEVQKKVIIALKQFKEKVESYNHIGDIDKLWEDALKIRDEISSISNDIINLNVSFKKQLQAIETLNEFKNTLKECKHLKDIDILWNQSEKISKDITIISNKLDESFISIETQAQSIVVFKQFKDRLDSYDHLSDIDETWKKCNDFEEYFTSTKDTINTHEEQINVLKNCLQEMQKQNDERNKTFSKKLKIAYALVSSSIGIAIIEFILLKLRII